MKQLSILIGALALPLAASAYAAPRDGVAIDLSPAAISSIAPAAILPEMAGADEPTVQLAQASDPRVVGLEEQVRQLNGRIEEMNFQILQLQEQMRKMQEDVDFRLQEVEQKRGDAGSAGAKTSVAEAKPAETTAKAELPPVREAKPNKPDSTSVAAAPAAQGPGAPEKPLGSLKVDEKGNVTGGEINAEAVDDTETDGETVAALPPSSDNPSELYKDSYEHILSGDYGTAEAGFRKHVEAFPKDPQTADARYWLGEALLGQQRYRDAAEVFVDANRQFPDSRKSPDMLLKLGVSLSALNQRDVACATFDKIGQRYPKASASLKERVKQERALAGC